MGDQTLNRKLFWVVSVRDAVALGILIVLLSAILFPSVRYVHVEANRMRCANNLKQIAIAANNYMSAYSSLPSGGISMLAGFPEEYPAWASGNFHNWAIEMLPYIISDPTYRHFTSWPVPNEYQENPEKTIQKSFKTYTCPIDIDTDELGFPISGPGRESAMTRHGPHKGWARGSYRAVAGASTDGETFWDHYSTKLDRKLRGAFHSAGFDPIQGGTFSDYSYGVAHADIKDGMSHTAIIGEHAEINHPGRRTFWAITASYWNKSTVTNQQRILGNDYDACVAAGGPGGAEPCKRSFGSFHPGGMNFAFGDGHVEFIRNDVDIDVLVSRATIDSADNLDWE